MLFAHAHAVCCSVLWFVAVCFSVCSVLQCVALCCCQDTLPGATSNSQQENPTRHMCNMLQRTLTHCNTLRHTATHCNTLQHTEHTETHAKHFAPLSKHVKTCRNRPGASTPRCHPITHMFFEYALVYVTFFSFFGLCHRSF